jgi:hypothetical protein
MALTDKKYEKFYKETGSGDDKITTTNKDYIKTAFEFSASHGFHDIMDDPKLGSLVYMIQQMQDELDYLRTEISNNKDKTGISSSQASAITANTAKTGITTKQATAITNNSNNIDAKMTVIPNQDYAGVQSLRAGVVLNKDKSYSLVFSYAEVTPKGTTTRTGSIQLK